MIHSKKNFPGKFDGTILKVRQILIDTHIAQTHKWQKNLLIFVPRVFFLQAWHVPHAISTSNIYFMLLLLIPVIVSCIAAGYDHFRPFYQNLKNCHSSSKIHVFFVKIEKNLIKFCFNFIKTLKKYSKTSKLID